MPEFLEIQGGRRLCGAVRVGGAKNATLPMLLASILTAERCEFDNVPNIADVSLLEHMLTHLGGEVEHIGHGFSVRMPELRATETSYSLVKALRASFWVLGPLLARGRAARVALPGGDIIGARPVDIHLAALEQMGAEIRVKHGVVYAAAPQGLRPADITLRYPSVGATHQLLMAAALTPGVTLIRGAAREPEIAALAEMLGQMGAEIEGAGSDTIVVRGRSALGGCKVGIIGDRIEAGTYLLAAASAGGDVRVEGIFPEFLGDFLGVLQEIGVRVEWGEDYVALKSAGAFLPLEAATAPFPGLATDLQAPLMALLATAQGTSRIEENIYEGRFGHVSELCRMGARITVEGRAATVTGVPRLSGAPVEAMDIRAAAALVIAALGASGMTVISEPDHIRRGYEGLDRKLQSLGAAVAFKEEDAEDLSFAGC